MDKKLRIRESNILVASDGKQYTVLRAYNSSIEELAVIDIPDKGPAYDTDLILNTIKGIAESFYIATTINDGEKRLSQLLSESHYPLNRHKETE